MKIAVDTNVLLRLVLADDEAQQRAAVAAMESAELVAVSTQALCELAWVLHRTYGKARADIAATIGQFLDMNNVVVDRPAAEAGLAMLSAGGDFADGVIAYEGKWLGGETFVSFDRGAIRRLVAQGRAARLPG